MIDLISAFRRSEQPCVKMLSAHQLHWKISEHPHWKKKQTIVFKEIIIMILCDLAHNHVISEILTLSLLLLG